MSTSEGGAQAEGAGAGKPDEPESTDEDSTLEGVATFLITTFVDNAACAAVELLQHTTKAFEESLNTALRGDYTASSLAKDSALLWARNVQFMARLFSVGAPTGRLNPPTKDDRPAGTAGGSASGGA